MGLLFYLVSLALLTDHKVCWYVCVSNSAAQHDMCNSLIPRCPTHEGKGLGGASGHETTCIRSRLGCRCGVRQQSCIHVNSCFAQFCFPSSSSNWHLGEFASSKVA